MFGLFACLFDQSPVLWIMILDFPIKAAFGSSNKVSGQFVTAILSALILEMHTVPVA